MTTTTQTIQQRMRAKLEQAGLPFKAVEVYGRQIVVTAWSHKSALQWNELLGMFCTVRRIVKTADEAKENKGTVLLTTMIPVWRVFAAIK